MPSIFDFSAAGPWLVSGFLIGLLACWLFRKFFGSDAGPADELANLSSQLDAAHEKIAAFAKGNETLLSKANYYESEFNSLLATNTALNQDLVKLQNNANQGGGEASRFATELASTRAELQKLRQESVAVAANVEKTYLDQISGLKSQLTTAQTTGGDASRLSSELASTKAALEKLRAESNAVAANAEKTYLDQISGLKTQLAAASNAGSEAATLKSEVTRLTSDLAMIKQGAKLEFQAVADEKNALKVEVTKLAAALSAAQANHQSAAMELHTTKNDLHQVRSGLEETSLMVAQRHSEIEQLKAKLANVPDVESYKRFKDALEAANRIAAGLPDKA